MGGCDFARTRVEGLEATAHEVFEVSAQVEQGECDLGEHIGLIPAVPMNTKKVYSSSGAWRT